MMYRYKAKVIRVVDGDTYRLEIDLGFRIKFTETVRLYDADTPETYRPKSEAERKHGKEATAFVKGLIEGKEVIIETYKDKKGKYGRYLAQIITMDEDGTIGEDLKYLLEQNDLLKRETYEE